MSCKNNTNNKTVDEINSIDCPTEYSGNLDTTPEPETPMITVDVPAGEPIENYEEKADADTIAAMNSIAQKCSANAKIDNYNIVISPVTNLSKKIQGFVIKNAESNQSYIVYLIGSDIYFRDFNEFKTISNDIKNKLPGCNMNRLKMRYDKVNEPIKSYSVSNRDDCFFVIDAIFSSLTGKPYDKNLVNDSIVTESCKLRRHNKLGTDGDVSKSVKYHDAKYGSADENAFKQEIEDKQKTDGTVGCLDQQQQESVQSEPQFRIKLPNVHAITEQADLEMLMEAKQEEIIYEPGDRVLVNMGKDKETKKQIEVDGVVKDVIDNSDNGQQLTVFVNGSTMYVHSTAVKPNIEYMKTRFTVGDDKMGINPKTRLTDIVKNDDTDYSKDYKDLNDRNVQCDILVNGFKVNFDKYYASLNDILESKKVIRVMNESGKLSSVDASDISVDEENWPYAVLVDSTDDSDEPLRKLRINPTQYVEAEDDDMVDCIIGNKHTEVMKKNIKILS